MHTRRLATQRAALIASTVLAAPPIAAAQGASVAPPDTVVPITWCRSPAENVEWKRRTVYLSLAFNEPDTAAGPRELRSVLPFMLAGIASSFIADHDPEGNAEHRTAADIPRGEPRYGPAEMYTFVRFHLRGDGSVDSVDAWGKPGSILREDLMSALLATIARGDVFGPYADSTVRTKFFLRLTETPLPGDARWPAFTLNLPVDRPARWLQGKRPDYPAGGIGWRGRLRFVFDIDADGRVVPGSIRNVVPPDSVKWQTTRHRRAYESFAAEVERTLTRMRYEPAQRRGCSVPSSAVQDFVFGGEP